MHILLAAVLSAPLAATQVSPPAPASPTPPVEATCFEDLARLTRPAVGTLGLQALAQPADVYHAMSELAQAGSPRARAWCARHLGAAPAETALEVPAAAELFVRLALDHGGEDWLLDPALDPLTSLASAGQDVRKAVAAALAPVDVADADPSAPMTLALRAMALAPRTAPDEARRAQARGLLGELFQRFPKSPLAARAQRLAWRLDHLSPGVEAPELSARDADGNELRLTHLRGRPVLVDVWSLSDEDLLERVASRRSWIARHGGQLVLFGVGRADDELTFRRALEELDLAGTPCAFEASGGGPAAAAWRLDGGPTTVLVDATGRVRAVDVDGPELEAAVEALLNGDGVGEPEGSQRR